MIELIKPNINTKLISKRVSIIPVTKDFVTDKYVNWLNDKETNMFLEVRWKKQTKETIVNYINSIRKKKYCEVFAILDKNQKHIGNVAITDCQINTNKSAVYGLVIGDKVARSFGLGFDVSIMIIDYLFSINGINRIQESCFASNNAAHKLLERLGFVQEGVLRSKALLQNGKFDDSYVYGILKNEWLLKRPNFDFII